MKLRTNETDSRKTVQLLFLIAAGIVIYPAILADSLFPSYGTVLLKEFILVPCMLFLGSALTQRLSSLAQKCLLLSAVMVFWFVTVQMKHYAMNMGMGSFGVFLVAYLLAFPYASVVEEGRKNTGLNWIGGFYMAYALLMVVLAGLLLLDMVPEALTDSVKWEGARASILSHPNGGGCILMLGIGFSLYFMTRLKNKRVICVLGVLTVLEFLVLALTNSRTSIFLTCAMFVGTLFFIVWKDSWKRFLTGIATAAVVIAVLFSLAGTLYAAHSQSQLEKLLEQEGEYKDNQYVYVDEQTGEYILVGSEGTSQGDLSQDMGTLNGRTHIWEAAFTVLEDNPVFKIWGTEYIAEEISYRNYFPVVNAHNSWIQMLLLLGIPGCILALVYTVIAVWNIWILMWRKDEDLSKKVVAMIVICLLVSGILEVYLFTGDSLFSNFIFFLCTGYLIQWNAEASGKI